MKLQETFDLQTLSAGKLSLPLYRPSVRSTSLDQVHGCPRYWALANLLGLRRKTHRRAADIGTIYHKIRAALWSPLASFKTSPDHTWKDEVWNRTDDLLLKREEDLHKQCDAHDMMPWGDTWKEAWRKAEKDLRCAQAMAFWAEKFTPLDPKKWTTFAVERKIERELCIDGHTHKCIIRPDAILRSRKSPWDFARFDHKTTKDPLIEAIQTIRWSTQEILYGEVLDLWLKETVDPKARLVSSIHSVIARPTIRLKKDQSPRDYAEEVTDWYADDPKPGTNRYVQSEIFREDSEENTIALKHQMERQDMWTNYGQDLGPRALVEEFPKAQRFCQTNYHYIQQNCEYLPLCGLPFQQWDEALNQYESSDRDEDDETTYEDVEWLEALSSE